MNILSPNFIDFSLDFRNRSFLNIASLNPIYGGVSPLLNVFKNINWIKPSAFNNLCNDNVEAYFVDIGDGVKRTAVNYRLCEVCIDTGFFHVMYGDYFKLRPASEVSLSVDFAGLADVDHAEEILSCSNVKYVFCSEHDSWADTSYLNRQSRSKVIIWHSPECVRLYANQSMYVVPNNRLVATNKVVVGAGDLFAVCIMSELYEKSFKKVTVENLIKVITTAINFVNRRCFS